MGDMWSQKGLAAAITSRIGSWINAAAAGTASNGAVVVGNLFQRSQAFGPNRLPLSVAVQLLWSTTLGAARTFYLGAITVEDSADGVTWAVYAQPIDPGVVATGPAGGGTLYGTTLININLAGARDWIRMKYTPTLSNTATDAATVVAALAFAGFDRLPAPV